MKRRDASHGVRSSGAKLRANQRGRPRVVARAQKSKTGARRLRFPGLSRAALGAGG